MIFKNSTRLESVPRGSGVAAIPLKILSPVAQTKHCHLMNLTAGIRTENLFSISVVILHVFAISVDSYYVIADALL